LLESGKAGPEEPFELSLRVGLGHQNAEEEVEFSHNGCPITPGEPLRPPYVRPAVEVRLERLKLMDWCPGQPNPQAFLHAPRQARLDLIEAPADSITRHFKKSEHEIRCIEGAVACFAGS